MAITDFPKSIRNKYEIYERRHASAVLRHDFPQEWDDLVYVLSNFELLHSYIEKGGGNKSKVAIRIDKLFSERGWNETSFDVEVRVGATAHPSPTHAVDHVKNKIAVEMEWNNKDPFFDRDLNNFRLLHQLDIISVGIIITRTDELKEIFTKIGRAKSFGESTTHMSKLLPKIEGGGAAECPILVFGISKSLYNSKR